MSQKRCSGISNQLQFHCKSAKPLNPKIPKLIIIITPKCILIKFKGINEKKVYFYGNVARFQLLGLHCFGLSCDFTGGIMIIDAHFHTISSILLTVGFWCQAIHKRFDTSFEIKMMVKIYAIEIIFKSHEPFQPIQPERLVRLVEMCKTYYCLRNHNLEKNAE